MCIELENDKTLLENALFWARKNGNIDAVEKMMRNPFAYKEDILDYCNPRKWGTQQHPCVKVKSVRSVENDETRAFDIITDFDGSFYKHASEAEKKDMYKHLKTLYELFDFQAFMKEMEFDSTFILENLQEEFSRAVAWYLGRIDVKNAEAISLCVAAVLSDAPLSMEGLKKCANDLANELGDIRYQIVRALTKRLQQF
jgi:hypothetical protein